MNPPLIRRLVVCGVGLIGGSFALALKAAGQVGEVVGLGRSPAGLDEALRLGVIDRAETDWALALDGCDFVLLATPVGQMETVLRRMLPHLETSAVVTDGGSTKRDVVAAARAALGARAWQFVPGHPIAGAERSGAAAARADLYRDRRVVLTPLPENREADVARVQAAWQACGARLTQTSAEHHDRWLAAVSHLPHLLSFALVDELAGRPNAEEIFGLAGGGFRDFTRIAASHPEMWRDIFLANRDALLDELSAYEAELSRIRALIDAADAAGLEALIARSRAARTAWGESQARS